MTREKIRGFEKRDLTRLHQLDQICFPPEIAYSHAELQFYLRRPSCSCWIAAQAGDSIVGFLILERVREPQPAGHILTLDIDPADRRRGLGARLMHTAEVQMKHEGVSRMSLEVAQNNAVAQHFYRSLGFVVTGRIAKYYAGTIDADVMEKAI